MITFSNFATSSQYRSKMCGSCPANNYSTMDLQLHIISKHIFYSDVLKLATVRIFEIASVAILVISSTPADSIAPVFAMYFASNITEMMTNGAEGKMTKAIFQI